MAKPCDLDKSVQDPYDACPYCGAIPLAACRAEPLTAIEEARLTRTLKAQGKLMETV